jgi:2-polyprenyl-6-methoxyphenol hydroxylase-like FAD-dependent oxidoreductase
MQTQEPFKVLIVGAGVTGLTLAHCLAKANVEFVLVDKGAIAPAFGNTITLFPHGIRILHQLDCLDVVMDQCASMDGSNCRGSNGKVFAASENYFGIMETL